MHIGPTQSLDSLRLFLFDRPLHPELFEIHQDIRLARGEWDAQIWITGCTHVIGFYRGDQSLLEVVADDQATLPRRGEMISLPLRGEKAHEKKQLGGIDYMMNFQTETMSPRVYRTTHHEMARKASRRGIFVPFPHWMVNSLTPYSYLTYEARENHLHIMAFHAFPGDLTMVKTQSIFELG
jgi:hypothetical protein